MVEWATEYVSDLDDIRDGTYCFDHDCPPTAQGLAQTKYDSNLVDMLRWYHMNTCAGLPEICFPESFPNLRPAILANDP